MLEERLQKYIDVLIQRYPVLKKVSQEIIEAYLLMKASYQNGGKLLIAGMVDLQQMQNTLRGNL